MKLLLYGTAEKPIVVDLEPRSLSTQDRSLDYFKYDVHDDNEQRLRESRQKSVPLINSNTDWSNLVGKLFPVREEDDFM